MFIILGMDNTGNKFVVMSDQPMQTRLYSLAEDAEKVCKQFKASYQAYDYYAHNVLESFPTSVL